MFQIAWFCHQVTAEAPAYLSSIQDHLHGRRIQRYDHQKELQLLQQLIFDMYN